MDIRYATPLVVNEVFGEDGQEPCSIALASKPESGSANAQHRLRDRPCESFAWNYLRHVLKFWDEALWDEKLFFLPIAWDTTAFVHDGSGTFIVSKALLSMWPQCQKLPVAATRKIKESMGRYMGAKEIIWIDQSPEQTDRPLSSMVRFVRYGVILISRPPTGDGSCPWEELYAIIYHTLNSWIGADKKKRFQITEIQEARPSKVAMSDIGEKADRCGPKKWPLLSYLTYIHVKDAILLPAFGDKNADDTARLLLAKVFGTKTSQAHTSSIRVHHLPWWGSSLYSITQHVPLAPMPQLMPPPAVPSASKPRSNLPDSVTGKTTHKKGKQKQKKIEEADDEIDSEEERRQSEALFHEDDDNDREEEFPDPEFENMDIHLEFE